MDTYIPTDDGQWVSEKFERLQRVIQDYDPNLELAWIPPANRTREDKKPFCVVHTNPQNGKRYTVLYASELDTPEHILARLWGADEKNGDVLSNLDKHNEAAEALRLKAKDDKWEEMHDKADFLFNTEKHWINMGRDDDGQLIRMDDSRRRI